MQETTRVGKCRPSSRAGVWGSNPVDVGAQRGKNALSLTYVNQLGRLDVHPDSEGFDAVRTTVVLKTVLSFAHDGPNRR